MVFLKSKKKLQVATGVVFIIIFIFCFSSITLADDDNGEEDENRDDDFAKDIAYVSVGLFVATAVTILIYMTNKYSRRFLGEEGRAKETKDWISQAFRKIRKPLNYSHYFVGFAALTTLLIHGIRLSERGEKLVAIGWITTVVYIFYVLSGLVIWLKIKPFWNSKKMIRILNKLHRSLIFFVIIVILHLIHVIMAN